MYYAGGQLKAVAHFKDGVPVGTAKQYYKSGKIQYIDTYKDGQMINRRTYGESGQLLPGQGYPAE